MGERKGDSNLPLPRTDSLQRRILVYRVLYCLGRVWEGEWEGEGKEGGFQLTIARTDSLQRRILVYRVLYSLGRVGLRGAGLPPASASYPSSSVYHPTVTCLFSGLHPYINIFFH